MNENILQQLMQGGYGDQPGPHALMRRYQDLLGQFNSGRYRNVGPQDFMSVPDRNGFRPDDIMQQLMLSGRQEDI